MNEKYSLKNSSMIDGDSAKKKADYRLRRSGVSSEEDKRVRALIDVEIKVHLLFRAVRTCVCVCVLA